MDDRMFDENMRRIQKDDKESLRAIYLEYRVLIYTVIYNILHNREDSEDLASDFFIRLWNSADKYRPGRGHRAWMITIARNMALDFLRKHEKEILTDEVSEDVLETEDAYRDSESSLVYRQITACLEPTEREIVDLKILGELTFKEISLQLKKPPGTVSWLYNRAMNKMKGAAR